ncbi:MAG TPA: hypothetical protein VIE66_18030 [Methylocella sp.]
MAFPTIPGVRRLVSVKDLEKDEEIVRCGTSTIGSLPAELLLAR